MAREEYDREVQARREAEYEMIRLKKELQEQASKLSALNEAQAKQEHLTRQSQDLRNSVVDIEQELRKMKIERDLTYAEMEELAATAKCVHVIWLAYFGFRLIPAFAELDPTRSSCQRDCPSRLTIGSLPSRKPTGKNSRL